MKLPSSTDFGFEQVSTGEKARRVARVFSSVASRYDFMNDVMSAGLHRLWKRQAVHLAGIRPDWTVLDAAGGTGDMAALIRPLLDERGRLVVSDINADMLQLGRDRLVDEGYGGIDFVRADAETLPFRRNSFDLVTIAFGLRNVTDKDRALRSMHETLRYGGRLVILEFSRVILPLLAGLYDFYSFRLIPVLGRWIAGDEESYRYLVESIRMHPDQEALKGMLEDAGFSRAAYYNLSGGIVAIHKAYKL
jgi:demethylmenaquinone methyltransferase/2-methoxy-6-polyprenyl-1,4-benzoquinol methylase